MSKNNKLFILIEDNEEDVYAIKRVFNSEDEVIPITHFNNGEQALEYLKQSEDTYKNTQIIVLLDLNLPGLDGYTVLQQIRNMSFIQFIPIIVFTSSISDSDVQKAYTSGANSFLKKNVQFNQFKEDILSIKDYWFSKNIYPYQSIFGNKAS